MKLKTYIFNGNLLKLQRSFLKLCWNNLACTTAIHCLPSHKNAFTFKSFGHLWIAIIVSHQNSYQFSKWLQFSIPSSVSFCLKSPANWSDPSMVCFTALLFNISSKWTRPFSHLKPNAIFLRISGWNSFHLPRNVNIIHKTDIKRNVQISSHE